MNWSEDSVTIGRADIAILDQEVLGIFGEVRSFKDANSRGTVCLERGRSKLWVS